MEIKNWKALKEFANSLTAEQLEQAVYIYPEDSARIRISEVTIEEQALYYEVGAEAEGCFRITDFTEEELEGMEVVEGIPVGSIMLGAEL